MKDYQKKRKEAWALIMADRKARSGDTAAASSMQKNRDPSFPSTKDDELTSFSEPRKLMEFLQSGR